MYVTRDGGANWTKIAGHGLPACRLLRSARSPSVSRRAIPIESTRRYRIPQRPGLYRSERPRRELEARQPTSMRLPSVRRTTRGSRSRRTMRILLYFPSVVVQHVAGRRNDGLSNRGRGGRWRRGQRWGCRCDAVVDRAEGAPAPGAGLQAAGGDNHDVWIDPTNASRVLVANDAGVEHQQQPRRRPINVSCCPSRKCITSLPTMRFRTT